MKRVLYPGLFLLCAAILFGQSPDEAKTGGPITEKNKIAYPIKLKFPFEVYNVYKMTETSKVKRVYEDSTSVEYDKIYSYYFTIFTPGKPVDGFQLVKVSVDSIHYKYAMGGKIVEYDNNAEDEAPLNFRDFLFHFLPVGMEMEVTYNGYGEISKVGGASLLDKRKTWGAISDTARRDFVTKRISDDALLFITDVAKGLLPDYPVSKDSSWATELYFEMDGLPYKGKTVTKLTDVQKGSFYLTTQCDSLTMPLRSVYLNDIKTDAAVSESNVKGKFDQVLNSAGSIQYAEGNFESQFRGKANNIKFVQTTVTRFQWDVLERYSY